MFYVNKITIYQIIKLFFYRVFLTTRNPHPELTPDVASVVNEVNFTTTSAGLTGQVIFLL